MTQNNFLLFRNSLGLDQTQTAAFLDIPRGTWIKWENGQRKQQNAAALSLINLWQQLSVLYPELVQARINQIKG